MVIPIHGIELHYELFGEGEPLLWLHGGMGAGSDWRYVFEQPPTGYRLIAPDLRGHGASTNPSNVFSFRQCARDAIPHSYLWVVPNGGHGPTFGDAAPRFRETALSFLRGEWADAHAR
jgi:pimeloyl-ACP methyl ester carboxylesterase